MTLRDFYTKNRYPLLLFIISVLCYFEIALFLFIPKWDNIDAFMPYRYVVGDWIASGNFPQWNPYEGMGYPIHADPQSGAWYPVVWLLSLFGGYSFISLNFELWLHIFLAGLGTYHLARALKLEDKIAFFSGIVFMLSGFFVGSGQLLVMFIGAAWLPFSLLFLYKSIQAPSFKHIFLLSLVNAFTVMGAYPALTVILFYIHLVAAVYLIYKVLKKKYAALNFFKVFGGVFLLTVLLSFGYIYSIVEMIGYMSREEAIPYTYQYFGKVNFDARCYLTFIYPFSCVSDNDFYKTDVSFINAYIGLIPLLLCGYGVIRIKDKRKWYFVGLLIFFLLYAAGSTTPFHKLFYDYVPGFDRFRHTAFFRIYIMLLLALFSGWSLDRYLKQKSKNDGTVKGLLTTLGVVVGGLFVWSLFKTDYAQVKELLPALLRLNERVGISIYGHIVMQGIIQLTFLAILFWLYKRRKLSFKRVVLITVFDLFIAIQLNAPTTLYYNKFLYKYQALQCSLPTALTNQAVEKPLREMTDTTFVYKAPGLWQNLGDFNKQTAPDGYNPFKFKRHISISGTELQQHVYDMPLAYFPKKTTTNVEEVKRGGFAGVVDEKNLVTNNNEGVVKELQITREGFEFDVVSEEGGLLFIDQNYHHNWKASFNGEQTPIFIANKAFMGVELPKGEGTVKLTYNSKSVFPGLVLFFSVLLGGVLFLFAKRSTP